MLGSQFARVGAVSALLLLIAPIAVLAGPTSANASSAKPTGTTLVIGSIEDETGAGTSASITQGADTLTAWTKWTNAHGGINGHPVKLIVLDSKNDPAVGLADAKTLVQSDGAIALVGIGGATDQTWAPYMLSEKVPVIGGQQIDAEWFTNAMFYPVGGTVISDIWGIEKAAALEGVKKGGVLLCTSTPACAQAEPLFKNDATSVGINLTYDAAASATQPSYTAECLAAKQEGVQAMAAFVNDVVLARDCARQNFDPRWQNADGGPGVSTIESSPALGDSVGSSDHFLCLGPQTAQIAEYTEIMKKYAPQWLPGGKKYPTTGTDADCANFEAALAFRQAILNADIAPKATATAADVILGLSMFKGETLGGYTPPLTYGDGTAPNSQEKCVYLYKWKGTKFVPLVGGDTKYTCQP
jgi:branched-chain amino acid transport system substrate-binding protein